MFCKRVIFFPLFLSMIVKHEQMEQTGSTFNANADLCVYENSGQLLIHNAHTIILNSVTSPWL